MATIVGAFAASHGPLLSMPPELWHLRAGADMKNPSHWFQGRAYSYAELLEARAPGFADAVTQAQMQARFAACQVALDTLAERFAAVQADLVLVLGNDQREVFKDDLTPALTLYSGAQIDNIALSEAQRLRLPPGVAEAEDGHCPPEGAVYPGAPAHALQLAAALCDAGFDPAVSHRLPQGEDRQHGIPHAFGFVYRRVMRDAPPLSVPLFLNVGVAPNQPRVARCLALGHALGAALKGLPDELRVAVVASGGMSHFVVDEALDQMVLQALAQGDEATLCGIAEPYFNGNTAEIKSWLPLVGIAQSAGLTMNLIDYVACYRSPAGTGSGMAFASWS
ncbi:protocatechuate 3,4-dioxygenase [Paraburkholderia bonniea]|uniref:DODA-type extradiol aromatic ring-opening family dioxygenase n=1 Tax=Paraburkholderia bonniea TaxID=2152891 RepID=UPI0025739A48|nr:protocatechuate 3,4-dioxygenase [Paraburkholderia bonniea]WJF91922.1 protocatechuate 3,4-dioxygenase [Paraburkholderia bonniea]WJF95241.1 protocatechuate 3,4-dioxygenase [Paraburkholderia bonniea]